MKKITATSGKLIKAVYASYVCVYTCILYIPLPLLKETLYPYSYHNDACVSPLSKFWIAIKFHESYVNNILCHWKLSQSHILFFPATSYNNMAYGWNSEEGSTINVLNLRCWNFVCITADIGK